MIIMKPFENFFINLLFLSILTTPQLSASDTHFFVIPGQNGLGGQNCVPEGIINPFSDRHITYVETPSAFIDFGQHFCMQPLNKSIKPVLDNDSIQNFVLHASSQGTATALNYTSHAPHKVKALILESVMGSGNSAIYHTVKTMMAPGIASFPESYYWMPYFAKFSFPFYQPGGQQPILSLDTLPKDILVIIIHATKDPQLSHNDALSLYYRLRHLGNENVYLFSIDVRSHIFLLNKKQNPREIRAINQIFKNNNLPYNKEILKKKECTPKDLKQYQPPEDQYKALYESLIQKENIIQNYVSKIMTAGVIIVIGWLYITLTFSFIFN